MRAVRPFAAGSPAEIEIVDLPPPELRPGEALVRVAAAGLNRADLLQMRGNYAPPAGEPEVPGLECAGVIEALGESTGDWRVGDRAVALLAGGGQAELVAVPVGQLMPWPRDFTAAEAGGLPEAALTAWTNLVREGDLREGEVVLVTGATSGVGTFAVQLARELGATVIAAGRSRDRLRDLSALGVERRVILDEGFVDSVRTLSPREGVDLVLDLVGGEWTAAALQTLAPRGRLVLVGLTAGAKANVDLAVVLRRRLRIVGSVLRSRTRSEKAELVRSFRDFAEGKLSQRVMFPIVAATFPFERAAEAYRTLVSGGLVGKVVLTF